MSDEVPEPLTPEQSRAFDRLRVSSDGLCWWCRERQATTREHKYKHSDLKRVLGDDNFIGVADGTGGLRIVRGKSGISRDRYGVVKFPKSMCQPCNGSRSQSFDRAYEKYSNYLASHKARATTGVPFERIYGDEWEGKTLDLARYYAKHFGCRMVEDGLPVPGSLRKFMDGATDMPDAQMVLVSTDSVHRTRSSLAVSGGSVWMAKDQSRFVGFVLAAYIGGVGVRYQWCEQGIPDKYRSQFFHYPAPVLNRFVDEDAVARGEAGRRRSTLRAYVKRLRSRATT